MFALGSSFDRYTIEALLGEGGMGKVFRAHDARLRRAVAIKILRVDGDGPDASARLLREARAAAALSHPNVVAIHDVGELDGVSYIVMELVEGRQLRDYVGDPTPLDRKIRWLVDVARALGAAHARGLIHRDIKPENVIVCADGNVKVLDFGIAKHVDTFHEASSEQRVAIEETRQTLTAEGRILGTPKFMSPEQVAGEPLDARSDQFSWALVAYELLAGIHAWDTVEREPRGSLVEIVRAAYPKPIGELAPDVPTHVQAVVWRALAKEPHRRFASMEELVEQMAMAPPPSRPSGRRTPTAPRTPERVTESETADTAADRALAVDAPRSGATTGRAAMALLATVALTAAGLFAVAKRNGAVPAPSAANAVSATSSIAASATQAAMVTPSASAPSAPAPTTSTSSAILAPSARPRRIPTATTAPPMPSPSKDSPRAPDIY